MNGSRSSIDGASAKLTAQRKIEHLDLVLAGAGQAGGTTGLERVRFIHDALPELDYKAIDLGVDFFGKRLSAPLLISSMTGGPSRAERINRHLAEAADTLGIAFAVGSQRVSLEGGASSGLGRELRQLAPSIPLLANIGGAQLAKGWGATEAQRAVDSIGADALIVHLNPLQEALQPEGDRDWRGVLSGIERLAAALDVPIVAKETGCGLSREVCRRLVDAGVAGLDVAGAGGTNWGLIEGAREASSRSALAAPFGDWGVRTLDSILAARSESSKVFLIASGGIENGVDVAKCLALGANVAGQAAAVLPAALRSAEAVVEHFTVVIEQLRTACFCTGSENIQALRQRGRWHLSDE